MKILQITHYGNTTNYGAVLQAYALQRALEKQGHEPILLRASFSFNNIMRHWYRNPGRFLRACVKQLDDCFEERRHPRKFSEFIQKNLNCSAGVYHSHRALLKGNLHADALVTGSDQVWSSKKIFPPYFLDFANADAKRFSYAASVGSIARMDESYLSSFRKAVSGFDAISVREFEGLEQCRRAGVANAELVLDPVFLLTPEEYVKLLALSPLRSKPYCLLYTVGKRKPPCMDELAEYCRQKDLDFLIVSSSGRRMKFPKTAIKIYPEIPDFVCLIKNASLVATDSFHGAAFSILFNRKFVYFSKNSHDARFETLDRLFGAGRALYKGDLRECLKSDIDYGKINSAISVMRNEGYDFISGALCGKRGK